MPRARVLSGVALLLLASAGCVRLVPSTGDVAPTPAPRDRTGEPLAWAEATPRVERAAVSDRPYAPSDLRRADELQKPELPKKVDLPAVKIDLPAKKADLPAKADLSGCDDGDVCTVDTGTYPSCAHSSYDVGPCLDQKVILTNNMATNINEGARYIAQTFTAAKSGVLAGVNVDVVGWKTYPLHVAIRSTATKAPTTTILAEATLATPGAPITQLITFSTGGTVAITAGTMYAIVVDYPSAPAPGAGQAGGYWVSNSAGGYSGGDLWSSNDGASWGPVFPGGVSFFRTFVRP